MTVVLLGVQLPSHVQVVPQDGQALGRKGTEVLVAALLGLLLEQRDGLLVRLDLGVEVGVVEVTALGVGEPLDHGALGR